MQKDYRPTINKNMLFALIDATREWYYFIEDSMSHAQRKKAKKLVTRMGMELKRFDEMAGDNPVHDETVALLLDVLTQRSKQINEIINNTQNEETTSN